MSNWSFKKISTHLMEGAGTLTEFWVVGIMHELTRRTKYFNGNVNAPHAGTFITIIFSLFYLARVAGSVISLKFAETRRFVLITYLFAIPAILFTAFGGISKNAYWIVAMRCIVGFCTSFAPVMCMLRAEESKSQLVFNFTEVKNGKRDQKDIGSIIGTRIELINGIEFATSFVIMGIASYVYTKNNTGIGFAQIIYACIIIGLLVVFFLAYRFSEPKVTFFF